MSKKLLCTALLSALLFASMPLRTEAAVAPGDITAETAVLMDAQTGQVLFDKNMNARAYPASITKIMTGLLAVESCAPDQTLTVSQRAVNIGVWNSSNIGLAPGEVLTVEQALYALMLPSANDAANALAEQVGGSLENFAAMMNQKAWAMGARNTNFANAHGLHDQNHYTTAYDMALITRYAAQNPDLMRYLSTQQAAIPPTNLQPVGREFQNQHYMLLEGNFYHRTDILGGKTGYTREAQNTLSTVAASGDRTLICVVMGSPGRYDKFEDTKKLLEYGFGEFTRTSLPDSLLPSATLLVTDQGEVTVKSEAPLTFLLRNDLSVQDIRLEADLPRQVESVDQLPAAATVFIETGDETLPALLGSQPLVAELPAVSAPVDADPAALVLEPASIQESLSLRSLPLLRLDLSPEDYLRVALLLLPLFALALLAHRYLFLARRGWYRSQLLVRKYKVGAQDSRPADGVHTRERLRPQSEDAPAPEGAWNGDPDTLVGHSLV